MNFGRQPSIIVKDNFLSKHSYFYSLAFKLEDFVQAITELCDTDMSVSIGGQRLWPPGFLYMILIK